MAKRTGDQPIGHEAHRKKIREPGLEKRKVATVAKRLQNAAQGNKTPLLDSSKVTSVFIIKNIIIMGAGVIPQR